MTDRSTLTPPTRSERNAHRMSREEGCAVESRARQCRGGGYRSGSRGAGTFATPDGLVHPRQRPMAAWLP